MNDRCSNQAADRGEAILIVALDISAAFDMVIHFILLSSLLNSFGRNGNALLWISSYLSRWSQTVRVGSASSTSSSSRCGVPQGSDLGPILFTVYTSPIAGVSDAHHMNQQQYADDKQLDVTFTMLMATASIHNTEIALHAWFPMNSFTLNLDKTEMIQMSTTRQAKELLPVTQINVARSTIRLSGQLNLLGVILDTALSFDDQINMCKASFFHICTLRHIWLPLTEEMANYVACPSIQSRLYYANYLHTSMLSANFDKLNGYKTCSCA